MNEFKRSLRPKKYSGKAYDQKLRQADREQEVDRILSEARQMQGQQVVISQLRELANKLERGGYVSELTLQELDGLLTQAIGEREDEFSPLSHARTEKLRQDLHEFATSIQQAISKRRRKRLNYRETNPENKVKERN